MAFIIRHNHPSVGFVSWENMNVQYNGSSWTIANGNTNRRYIWWQFSSPTVFQTSDPFPTLTAHDLLVIFNKNGTALLVPTASVVDGGLIVPGTIIADALSANSVTSEKLLAGAVSASHIAAGAIGATAIAANAVLATHISANAVTADKIVSGAVTAAKIAAGAVTANAVAANAIGAVQIAANAVISDKIAANAITAVHIAANSITVDKISAEFGSGLDISSNQSVVVRVTSNDLNTAISSVTNQTRNDLSQMGHDLSSEINNRVNSSGNAIRTETSAALDARANAIGISLIELTNRVGGNETVVDEIRSHFDFTATGLNIGKSSSPLSITINNEQMSFIDQGSIVAYVNGKTMYIEALQVLRNLNVGVHTIERFNNDISFIRWVG